MVLLLTMIYKKIIRILKEPTKVQTVNRRNKRRKKKKEKRLKQKYAQLQKDVIYELKQVLSKGKERSSVCKFFSPVL